MDFLDFTHSGLINDALQQLQDGALLPESTHLDYKEEPARRNKNGSLRPAHPENEKAVSVLAGEVACMANTPGGGVLIVGVADGGQVLGTGLDGQWLRRRLYETLDRKFTVTIHATTVHDSRILILLCPEAVEPIRWKNRYTWRVGTTCVEMDQTSWHNRKFAGWFDWSCQPSQHSVEAVQQLTIEHARELMEQRVDLTTADVTQCPPADLLTRIGALTHDGALTNGAALLFVGHPNANLDYIRRPFPGADRQERFTGTGQPLIVQLAKILGLARAYNPEHHVGDVVVSQLRSLPGTVLREVIVNAIAHRDWHEPTPIVINHVGDELTVTNPGGFFGGVSADNIINHRSVTRNVSIAHILQKLGIAEREAIGVDRMFVGMLALGHRAPEISERPGHDVTVTLCGGAPNAGWLRWLERITPTASRQDVRWLLLLHRLTTRRWADARALQSLLQISATQVASLLDQSGDLLFDHGPLVTLGPHVDQVGPLVMLSPEALAGLQECDGAPASTGSELSLAAVCEEVARHRSRISSAEAGLLGQVAPQNATRVLRTLEDAGVLAPSRENRRGPGFFYRYV